MTPREELEELFRRLLAPAIASRDDMSAVIMADAVLAAGYRKVEAGPDARETARKLLIEIGHCGIFEGHKGREFLVNDEYIAHIATAITAAVEAQRERDARIAERRSQDIAGWVRDLSIEIAAAIREG